MCVDYGMPGSLWFEVQFPCPFPLSRAVTSDMTSPDKNNLTVTHTAQHECFTPAGLWPLSQVQQPNFADEVRSE